MSWAASPAATTAGGGRPGGSRRGRSRARGQAARIRSVQAWVSVVVAAVIWVALLGPVITLFTRMSPGDVWTAITGSGDLQPLVTSLESAGLTLVVLIALGTPLAWLLARGRLPLQPAWEAGILCSLLLPPLVIGLLLVFLVGPYTWVGSILAWMHASATNTFLALVIAEVYESAPYYVLGAQSAFASVDTRLEEQAGLLGDPPSRVLRRVTLPLAAPGLVMSLAIAWARAIGAFGAVVIIAYHPFGIPMQIYTTLQETGLYTALPYALVLLVVALPLPLAAYVWSARAERRRRG
ncbi:MAG: ABC transporter permease subunit [Nocardiopsaceae bacterium]|nr:ABC transporter permease subunit [Nocardiopsaceae bacterium]